MKKKYTSTILLCMFLLVLAGCTISDEDPILFHISEPADKLDNDVLNFPLEATINYSISENYLYIVGEKTQIVFSIDYDILSDYHYRIYPVEKNKDGYKISSGEDKSYPMENPIDFGYTDAITLNKQQGSFTITFQNREEYNFFSENGISGLYDVSRYYKEKNKK